jgi:hypothetical protein
MSHIGGNDDALKWDRSPTQAFARVYPAGLARRQTSPMATIPANLYLFLRWVEFPGFGENFDEAAGNASEQAA